MALLAHPSPSVFGSRARCGPPAAQRRGWRGVEALGSGLGPSDGWSERLLSSVCLRMWLLFSPVGFPQLVPISSPCWLLGESFFFPPGEPCFMFSFLLFTKILGPNQSFYHSSGCQSPIDPSSHCGRYPVSFLWVLKGSSPGCPLYGSMESLGRPMWVGSFEVGRACLQNQPTKPGCPCLSMTTRDYAILAARDPGYLQWSWDGFLAFCRFGGSQSPL